MNAIQQQSGVLQRRATAEIGRIATFTAGAVGVAALHLESGLHLTWRSNERFPMASTVKMPLALAVIDAVARGALSWTQLYEIDEAEMTPLGSIGDEFPHPGVALSLANLLETTITRSDNTATDVLFRLVGGPAAVRAYLEGIGLGALEVGRTMRAALCVMHEIDPPPAEVSMRRALADLPPEKLAARSRTSTGEADYRHEERDHGTPDAMLELLRRLWLREGIEPTGAERLIDMMSRTRTSPSRIRSRLPHGVQVLNKTGSGTGTANDLGYLALPDGAGTVALITYVKGSPLQVEERDRAIADIARLVCDYFLLFAPRAGEV
ncbi:MAG TPA: serine hydrolase [Bosea sp. (in: a-proteobacteria)]|jgi:beta-lactamase class A|uniref:serine hydrolase n=1 Tax=Bosea sp. (in: a-proteobacteria) TaxID=1871050 RepID=UPI002E149397|nr:serine hydrolase [Bosea sp. (in: a-proteobacteria)]